MSGQWRMRILGTADELYAEDEPPKYLRHYDPDGYEGRGEVVLTEDPKRAKMYDTVGAVLEEWKRPSTVHPIRKSDGRPNRPLTAYSVQPEQVMEPADARVVH